MIRPIEKNDRAEIKELLKRYWASEKIVSRGNIVDAYELPGFISTKDNQILGFIIYHVQKDQLEITTLNSLVDNCGVGTQLITAVIEFAASICIKRIWCITTNDNLHAKRFYQKKGFHIITVHKNAIEISRKLKPDIPLFGIGNIPIRDEVELELLLL